MCNKSTGCPDSALGRRGHSGMSFLQSGGFSTQSWVCENDVESSSDGPLLQVIQMKRSPSKFNGPSL